jgi:hypothetical protein
MAGYRIPAFVPRLTRPVLTVVDTAMRHLVLVVVGVLVALGVLYLNVVGTVLTVAMSAGLGLLIARAWSADAVGPAVGVLRDGSAMSTTTVGVLALVGLVQVQEWGAVLGLMTLASGWMVLRWRLSGRTPVPGGGAPRSRGRDRPVRPDELADLLGRLPTDVLLAEWQGSAADIARRPGLAAEAALVVLRALLLDELEARDARGFSAWQRAAGRRPCSPVPFLSDSA